MGQSKQTNGTARDGSQCVKPEGDLFTHGSNAANQDRVEGHANRYAEASQAREIGKRPLFLDGPRLAQSKRTAEADRKNMVQIANPSAVETDQRSEATAKRIKSAPRTPDDWQKKASSTSLPRLMRVEDVAAYLNVSVSKVWRLQKRNSDFPPSIRMDGTTRWDRLDIDRFIEDSKTRGGAAR